jgi:hypothetical protein
MNIWHNTNTHINLTLQSACNIADETYGCESWTTTQTITKKMNSFELSVIEKMSDYHETRITNNDVLKLFNIKDG